MHTHPGRGGADDPVPAVTRFQTETGGLPAAEANFADQPARLFEPLVASRHLLARRAIARDPHPRPNRRRRQHRPALPMAAGALACSLLALVLASPAGETELEAGIPGLVLQIKGGDPMPPVVHSPDAGVVARF